MAKFRAKDILEATNGELLFGDATSGIFGISTDSRNIKEGDLFIAIKGERFDGHDFVEGVLKKGACGAIVSNAAFVRLYPSSRHIVIRVQDTLKALGDIANFHRMRFKLPIVAITGSCGKTTTKEMAHDVLSKKYNTLKNDGTENNLIGVPLTLLKLTQEHEAVVLELGMNHFGEIGRLSQIVRPTIGVITNIGEAHLEYLGDLDGVLKAKLELIQHIEDGGTLLLNGDDERLKGIKIAGKTKRLFFGIGNSNDFKAQDLKGIRLNSIGVHDVSNALCAFSIGHLMGVSFNDAKDALNNYKPMKGRLEVKRLNGITLIDDTYNANPYSVRVALDALARLEVSGKRIAVLGDMLELGEKSSSLHKGIGKYAAQCEIDVLIASGRFSGDVIEGASHCEEKKIRLYNAPDAAAAAGILKGVIRDGDCALVKGSRRMKMEEVIECFTKSSTR